jgi:signal peptidase I
VTDRAPPPPPVHHPRPSRRLLIIGVLAVAVPIAAIMTLGGFFLQVGGWSSFYMAAGSMAPSLLSGDRFLVDTDAYAGGAGPKRGDIIVFHTPDGLVPGQGRRPAPFVKRVMGVPGDRIQMVDGVPALNGIPVAQEVVGYFQRYPRSPMDGRRIRERLPDGAVYEVLKTPNGVFDQGPVFVVPAGAYFVMGDNRDDSLDSRARLASASTQGWYVPRADVIGQAKYIYWSGFERFGRIGMAVK